MAEVVQEVFQNTENVSYNQMNTLDKKETYYNPLLNIDFYLLLKNESFSIPLISMKLSLNTSISTLIK